MELQGRTALVMGGSKGLGYACAERFAAAGADLVLLARGEEGLSVAASRLEEAHGVGVRIQPVDLADGDALQAVLEQVGAVDVLLTNCGGPPMGEFGQFELADWDAAYQSQIRSAVAACRTLVPGMAERGWGRVLMIASVSVVKALPGLVLSNSLRPGLLGMARSLTREYAARGVTANLVCPGLTLTDRLRNYIRMFAERDGISEAEAEQRLAESIPARRLAQPEEVAAAAGFLARPEAAYISGQALCVDGGQTV